MNKKTLMSIVLLALIGTSAVFAQEPTLDKLAFANVTGGVQARAKDNKISGEVVIPDNYNGRPVITIGGIALQNPNVTRVIIPEGVTTISANTFMSATGLTSITIPASITTIERTAFNGCTNLNSVTFLGSGAKVEATGTMLSFPGDLGVKYNAGGAGTYTRPAGGTVWTKQGGLTYTGTGTRSDGAQFTLTGDGQTITITGTLPNGGKFTETYTRR